MADLNKTTNEETKKATQNLSDENRVKVLSPGRLVMKRFFRNRLAMVGLVIIVAMFSFAFIGGMVSPYGEAEVFREYELTYKDYAGVTYNTNYLYTVADGKELPNLVRADMILAINKNETTFTSGGVSYTLLHEGDEFYRIVQLEEVASAMNIRGIATVTKTGERDLPAALTEAYLEAVTNEETSFEVDGTSYVLTQDGREHKISIADELAVATTMVFNSFADGTDFSYDFQFNAQLAMVNGESSFEADGTTYTVELSEDASSAVFYVAGVEYASASHFAVRPLTSGVFLPISFKTAVEEAVEEGVSSFEYTAEDGTTEVYEVTRKDKEYTVKRETSTQVNSTYQAPSSSHWLGTDGNGMDIMTRLMYGGRISLMIGFIVVIIQVVLGILIGGSAGYFGGWIDVLCMRIVDIFNCIPSMPLYIILGSIMDFMKVDPSIRIYFLCLILGLLSWPGVARMVRGQILSLREQEFMIAAEATGISVRRRIFKHLVPNVIPQLIVMATMGLGNVILTEAALSFLGLGVKFPYASWGNIVNAVNDIYIMTNYLFVWIPAGFLILITVLGFNFIGDGLRDAFDPKMKR